MQGEFIMAETRIPPKIIYDFKYNEALYVYFYTDHTSCKACFNYKRYFEDAFKCILFNMPAEIIARSNEKVLRNKEILNPIDEYQNINKSTRIAKVKNFVAIDTETTGLKPGGNDIIEVCAIRFENFLPVKKFHTFLKPRNPIPAAATAINHITNDVVQNAPTFAQIRNALQEFIGDYPLVAHNAKFDMNFLHVSGLNLEGHTNKVYDTLSLSRLKLRDYAGNKLDSYKLTDVCEELNISCHNFHSAAADALACGIAFVDIIKRIHNVESTQELLA